jgi:hypothetical protein
MGVVATDGDRIGDKVNSFLPPFDEAHGGQMMNQMDTNGMRVFGGEAFRRFA